MDITPQQKNGVRLTRKLTIAKLVVDCYIYN